MQRLLVLLATLPLFSSCLVPLGYTPGRAQGMVSDSPSAQYLQLSMEYWQRGLDLRETSGGNDAALAESLADLEATFLSELSVATRSLGASGDETPLGDDAVVLNRTLAGTALNEVMNASARSSDAQAADRQEAEFRKVVESVGRARGLYTVDQAIWPDNTVNYRWLSADNPSPEHRLALQIAMDTWAEASEGRLRFVELPQDPWTNFQLTIGVVGVVVFQDAPLPPGLAGQATLGYQAGVVPGFLKLRPDLAGNGLKRTSLHELGHVLGLVHEHKRPDRDQWIDAGSAGYSLSEVDMGKVDEFSSRLRWTPVQVQIGAWSMGLYFPVWWKIRTAEVVGDFDMRSVMIYSGFLTKQDWADPEDPSDRIFAPSRVPWNLSLSADDVATIRALYR